MAINKTILKKISEKTAQQPKLKECLLHILEHESNATGRYSEKYEEYIKECCEGEDDED